MATKAEWEEFGVEIMDKLCDLFGVDNPLDAAAEEEEEG